MKQHGGRPRGRGFAVDGKNWSCRVQAEFGARFTTVPGACRSAVLVATLGGMAELAEVSLATVAAGGSAADLASAERAGLERVTPAGVIFSHPLVRAAARCRLPRVTGPLCVMT
jgi:hypothetical protein